VSSNLAFFVVRRPSGESNGLEASPGADQSGHRHRESFEDGWMLLILPGQLVFQPPSMESLL